MICQVCKTPFRPDQTVYVVVNDDGVPVNCCCPKCADEVEAMLKQQQLFKSRKEMVFRATEVSNCGCHLMGVAGTNTKDGLRKRATIDMPHGASIDQLLGFEGEQVTVVFKQERLDEIKVPVKAKVVHDEPEYQCLKLLLGNPEKALQMWTEGREFGMTDDELVLAFNGLVGTDGGSFDGGESGNFVYETKAGAKPKFWFGLDTIGNKPTFQGKTLVAAMRAVLDIAVPDNQKEKAKVA
jgi:hypothetical protein